MLCAKFDSGSTLRHFIDSNKIAAGADHALTHFMPNLGMDYFYS